MQGEIQKEQWQAYLDGFSKRNSGRTADLQILSDELGTEEEAQMLPSAGITLDNKGSLASSVEIILGGTGLADKRGVKLREGCDAHAVYGHTPSQLPNEIPRPDGIQSSFVSLLVSPDRDHETVLSREHGRCFHRALTTTVQDNCWEVYEGRTGACS